MRKTFVLDTNVLLHNADALTAFGDNKIVICMDVLEAMDRFKKENDEIGRNVRTAVRKLDELRGQGSLSKGVTLPEGGLLIIGIRPRKVPEDFVRFMDLSHSVNRILMTAHELQQAGEHVIFVSKDINARIKSDAIGVLAQDFEKQKIDFDHFYHGWEEHLLSPDQWDELNVAGRVAWSDDGGRRFPRKFFILKNSEQDNSSRILARLNAELTHITPLPKDTENVFSIVPRNEQQRMALDLLLDDTVSLVTLVGSAGTGKTLLALAAALQKVMEENRYHKILVSRPVIPLGRDLGYLPGSKDEKLSQWMHPIFDNLDFLLSAHDQSAGQAVRRMEDLFDEHLIELEALTYIRGRSIPRQFIIIDEAQNLTPHEVKTIVTRAGNHTKMILTGDPYQIDNPYLDANSNGLTYLVERMKEQKIFGHVNLIKSERSLMASLAAQLL